MARSFIKSCIILSLICFGSLSVKGQDLTLDYSLTAEEIAQNLVGEGVDIFNAQIIAADSSYAFYQSTNTEIGTSEGVLLSTGRAWNAFGPNDETGLPELDGQDCLNCDRYDNMFPGDPTLTTANGGLNTWDACKLQFDIVPQGDSLNFDFIFASEEYLEWVGSPFNDVFGFFISGPNVGSQVNIALVPGTTDPVAINNVNHIDNTTYFYDNQNPLGQYIQYDGFTMNLSAKVGDLVPCEVYTLELIIADGSDRLYDSAVFVSKIESNPITVLTSTFGGTDYMIEGCNNGTVTFESSFVPVVDLEVNFTIDGDAEFGVDYTTVPDLTPFYDVDNDIYTVVIPPGETFFDFEIVPLDDGLGEGSEIITISLIDQLCDGFQFNTSVDFVIDEELTVTLTPEDQVICNGQCVELDAQVVTAAPATFSWDPAIGLSDPNITNPEACPTATTTYTITNTVSTCVASESVTITVAEPEIIFDVDGVTCLEGNNGAINITVNNTTGDVTYTWTQDGIFFSNDQNLVDVPTGEYCVTVLDEEGCTSTDCIDVVEVDLLNVNDVTFSDYTCFPISCQGACDGSIQVSIEGGIAPYSTELDGTTVVGSTPQFNDLCAGNYDLVITDAIGCQITVSYELDEPDELEIEVVGSTNVLCTGEETGVITVSTVGGCPPYTYDWSHDPNLTAPIATSLPAGDFTVTVSDVNGCVSAQSVTISINEPEAPLDVVVTGVSVYPGGFNVSCNDASDGSIDIDITGGTFPYTPTWVHDQSGATYVNIEDLSDVPCGTYELTVVDDNGCTFNTEVELTCVPEFVVDVTTVPNPCGDPDALLGEIHVVVSGSHGGPYTLDWAGPSCPCAGPDLLNLTSGNYTLTITDIIGCEFVQVINVGTNDQFTVSETITDATCGGLCDGSIEIDIAGVPVDATEWTGPDGFTSSDEDIFDLCAGSYILNITSGTCEEQFVFIVGEPDPIDVDFINIVPPICFGQNNGALDITTSGGTGILTSEWFEQPECFFPATSGNSLSNLFECTYVVEVTDALGCSIQDSLFLDAPQVMDIFVSLSDFGGPYQISCNGESDGAISVSVDGGTQDCVTFDPECYFYDWTNCDAVNLPGVSQQSDLPAGSYCVVVTDANGCVATTEIDLVEPDPIESSGSISDYNGFGVSCFGECDGWITPAVIGGNDSYVLFDWIAGDIGANASDADTLFNLCPGIYELRVVDINDCEDVISFEITEPDALELSVDLVVDVSCYDYSDGELSVSATGGTGVYDFDWNNGEFNGQDLVGLPGGEYDLDLTDQNGCLLEQLVIVEEPDTFLVTLTVPILEGAAFTIPCKGDSTGAIFTSIQGGVPDLDILWTGGFFDDPTMADQSGLPAGTYTIDVTDADGCIATATAEITEPDEFLEVTSSVESLLCFGDCNGTVDLLVTGGVLPYTFIWELDNNGDTLSTLQNQTDLCAGMYEVLVSDANGCDTLLSFNFTSPEEILSNSVLSDHNGFNVSCPEACDGSITIAPSGGTGVITFTWLLNGEEVSEGATTLLGLCAGDVINLTLTDENDCVIEEVYVISSPEPIVANEVVVNLDCVGTETGSITLNPTGGDGSYTYEWTPDFGNVSEIEDLVPGQYCVVITDGNDCSIDMCWDITQPEQVTLSETSTDTNCGACDGSIELTVLTGLAPYSIIWTGPSSIDDDELNPTDLCQGVYTASVTDDNGCSEEIEITIEGIEAIDPGVELTQPLCYGDCNGSIQLNITNGTEPFTIVWTDLTTNEIVSNDELLDGICSGNFQLDIEDSLGCTFSDTYSIVEPSEIMINGLSPIFSNGYNVSTLDGTDGFIQTNVTGGTPDYSYDWSGPIAIDADVASPQFLPAGDYMLTVSDMNGCTKDTLFVLTQPEDLALPTGLSPNGDGANDTYVILGIDQYPSNDFKVFNRWGNLVYEKTNYNNEWAGTNTDGEELPDGTYYVIFTASEREFATYVDLRR